MTKCRICQENFKSGLPFYSHLEDIHLIPVRLDRIGSDGKVREETDAECKERFKFEHPEYNTEKCWCPSCLGGSVLQQVNSIVRAA